jgi:hypothetical protein
VTSIDRRRLIGGGLFLGAIGLVAYLGQVRDASLAGMGHPGFGLEEVSADVGIEFRHHRPTLDPVFDNLAPHIAALGAAVSVTDVNRDGWPDLYFTNSRFDEPNALYLNQADGRFVDIAAAAGVADLNREGEGVSMGSVWGDYDNDGFEDLLVYRYGYLQLFRNLGDLRFEDVTTAAGLRRWVNSNGAIWFDFDRDGLLDLYVTAYFRSEVDFWNPATTRIMHDSFEFAANGGRNLLFRNLGDGRFEDLTEPMGVGSTRWTLAAASADFNDDGWPDLYLANDYGPEEFFVNEAGTRFVLTRAGLETDSKSGMSVSLGDISNRGRLDVFVTNISERGYLFQDNNLRLNLLAEAGRFQDVASGVVADAGWAWGAQFGDLNNDGWNDLYVLNGFISADRDKSYWYEMSKVAGANGNIFEDARNWPAMGSTSLSGYERSRVLLNLGASGWVDVADSVGVTDEFDGRAVVLVDLFNRGVLDVVIANQDQPVTIYRNTVTPGNHWIGFSLEGTRSNRSAIGTEVVVEFSGAHQRKIVDGGMGFASQNDRRLHFGLGSAGRVERVVIHWPSGRAQTLTDLGVDRLHRILEPDGS